MKTFVPIVISLLLASIGYAADPGHVFPAEKQGLRKVLSPVFALTTVPKEKEGDFYRMLFLFAESRKPEELVTRVDFRSDSEARLSFSGIGMHDGGLAILKRESGKWTMTRVTTWSTAPNQPNSEGSVAP